MSRPIALLVIAFLSSAWFACSESGSNPGRKKQEQALDPRPTVILPVPGAEPPAEGLTIPLLSDASRLHLGTWNIENFPKQAASFALVKELLSQSQLDLWALEEIVDEASFQRLSAALPDYGSVLSSPANPRQVNAQKLAVLYRKSDFTLLEQRLLFQEEDYIFPRPPLELRLRKTWGVTDEWLVIVVHLKAFDEGQDRRRSANILLESYVRGRKLAEPNLKVMIMGDFNETLTEPSDREVYGPWLAKPELYEIATDRAAQSGAFSSLSSHLSLIDHIIHTEDLSLQEVRALRWDELVPEYRSRVSDHLPVIGEWKAAP